MPSFCENLSAPEVNDRLKRSLVALQEAESNAVLWFGEVVSRKLYRDLGHSSIHQYAAVELGFSKTKTSQFLTLCEAMKTLPRVRASVAKGEMPWTVARELVRVATPKTEKAWIEVARTSPRREIEKKVAEVKARAKSARKENKAQGSWVDSSAEVKSAGDSHDSRVPDEAIGAELETLVVEIPASLSLRLTPDQYARYEALLEKLRKQGEKGSREEVLLAGMEMLAESNERERGAQRQARETSAGAANEKSNTSEKTGSEFPWGNRGGSSYQVVVQLCPQCGEGEMPTSRGPQKIAPQTLRAILCDARIHKEGSPNRSTIPPGLRRRALERDRFQCRVAGCSSARFLNVHHLRPKETGGRNVLENLLSICSPCHRLLHEREDAALHGNERAVG